MAKNTVKTTTAPLKKQGLATPVRISYLLLLMAYGFVTVLTPNLNALDSAGPKFLTLALLNLGTYLFLFTRKEVKTRSEWYSAFFGTGIGIACIGLMVVSLLSFFKAINAVESVMHFTKIFTTFTAVYLVSVLIMADKRNVLYLCLAISFLLIVDSLTVFSGITNYIQGKLGSIYEIKSVYSNKNILASAIFVKIPFGLWLMVFSRKWYRSLGMLATFLAMTATFFMSTRAFYLGIFALTILLVLFLGISYFQSRDKHQLKLAGTFLILLLSAFLIFSATQHFLYPKTGDAYTVSVRDRLETIQTTESSTNARLKLWKRSWHLIQEEPLLGVGLGNWKIASLKEENLTSTNFIYGYKAHNDFIEMTAETGIFGGLFFIALFLLTGWAFIRAVFKDAAAEWSALLFLPAFGLLCYSVDAFFNFPQDRPELQALFAIYLGFAVAFTFSFYRGSAKPSKSDSIEKYGYNVLRPAVIGIYGLVLMVLTYILVLNFNSLKLQRIIADDIKQGKLTHPASMFLDGFPAIPDLNSYSEPIAVQKARYLIHEKRYDEAIALLKKDQSNPFHSLREALLAIVYQNQNNMDSCLGYRRKLYLMKPYYFKNIASLCTLLQQKGLQKDGEVIIDEYLNKTKNNKEAWLYASSFYYSGGNMNKAESVIDSAAHYFPIDSLVLKQKAALDGQTIIVPYQELYDTASRAYNANKYEEAARYYTELLIREPNFPKARDFRALCYYYLKEYTKSIQDLDFLISSGATQTNLFNLFNMRGANYHILGNIDEACKNYKIAAGMGDKDGLDNYSKLCKAVKK